MNASKENCRKAKRLVAAMAVGETNKFLTEFLDSCERKLPTEEAYKRDRQRRLVKK